MSSIRFDSPVEDTAEGDAACWLAQVCAECGAITEAAAPTTCWRCGRGQEPA